MGEKTGIEWTDATWNCWQGCHKVSPGCKNCYMYAEKTRYGQNPFIVVRSADSTFNAPLKWARNPQTYGRIKRIFVDSWSDFFIEEADPWRADAWAIMRQTPQFIYQLCTKRPERIAKCLPPDWGKGWLNVWLLTSTENQEMADLRIPLLLSVPAVVHGISAEPLLEALSLAHWTEVGLERECGWRGIEAEALEAGSEDDSHFNCPVCYAECAHTPMDECLNGRHGLDWVICGGESGPSARPMNPDWARSLRDQCKAAGVSFFFKQWGEWLPPMQDGSPSRWQELNCGDKAMRVGKHAAGSLLDGVEWKQFPKGAR